MADSKEETEELSNGIQPAKRRQAAPAPATVAHVGAGERPKPVPESVRDQFLNIGVTYYFKDGTRAFVDKGEKLATASENTELIRSLVAIAKSREWNTIRVTGSENFRREAWFAGKTVGIEVQGYKATAVEREQLARGLARHQAAESRNLPQEYPRLQSDSPSKDVPDEVAIAHQRIQRGEVVTGELLKHGPSTLRRDPYEQGSYFIQLKLKGGHVLEEWGANIDRAIRHSLSNVKIGTQVGIRNPKGEDWIVERTDFLEKRRQLAGLFRDEMLRPLEVVKKHPELQGSYLKLQAVKLGAEQDFKDPQTRAQLIQRGRALIAGSIERGEALEPVSLREAPERKPPEREQERSR